jgi:fatty-acyl-CoA synthase
MAVIVLKPHMNATPADLKAHVRAFAGRGLISSYAVPEYVVFATEIPKTSVGKIDKKRLRDEYGAPVAEAKGGATS